MTFPNHIAGGLVFTGVFGGFAGVNILNHPGLIVMTLAASTFADIDLPTSLWGRTFKPISRAINRRFGHRTLTHSIFFILLCWGLVAGACHLIGTTTPYPTVFLFAAISHIVLDMMTVQGVPIFYPYSKSPCVVPGDAKLRLRSSNPRSEIAVFGFFLISGIFLQPLMADGFWTSYNRLFGTMKHLQSEFEKSEDLLHVDFRLREGTQEVSGSGVAVECTGNLAILWNERDGWLQLDASPTSSRTILEVLPTHTDKRFELIRHGFVAISADSLDILLQRSPVYNLRLSANEPFSASYRTATHQDQRTVRTLDLQLVQDFSVFELPDEATTTTVTFRSSPRIRTLEGRIRKLSDEAEDQRSIAVAHDRQIEILENIRDHTNGLYEKQRAVEELRKLNRKSIKQEDIVAQVAELNAQIDELRVADQLAYEEKVAEARRKYRASRSPTLQFTGIVTLADFSPSTVPESF